MNSAPGCALNASGTLSHCLLIHSYIIYHCPAVIAVLFDVILLSHIISLDDIEKF